MGRINKYQTYLLPEQCRLKFAEQNLYFVIDKLIICSKQSLPASMPAFPGTMYAFLIIAFI